MSEKEGKRRYRFTGTDGSVAYDLNNPRFYPEYEYGRPLDIPEAPVIDEEVVTERAVVTTQAIAPVALVGFAIAAVLLVFSLFARIQLTTLSDECVALESSIAALAEQETRLRIAYESTLNLPEIESYAINTLGMQKPRSEQIYYISGNTGNRAEILGSASEERGFADRVGDFVSTLASYFGG